MVKHLFKDFLKDREEYAKAQKYWEEFLDGLFPPAEIKSVKRLNYHYLNGEEVFDGNPITDRYFENLKKTVRIIQTEVLETGLSLDVWTEKKEINDNEAVYELVVSLELSEESIEIVKEILKKWIIENYNVEEINRFLEAELYQKI